MMQNNHRQKSALEQLSGPQTANEITPGENGYAVNLTQKRFVCDENTMPERTFVTDGSKSLEIFLCDVARCLGLDCDFAVHDKVNLKIRTSAPIRDFGIAPESIGIG